MSEMLRFARPAIPNDAGIKIEMSLGGGRHQVEQGGALNSRKPRAEGPDDHRPLAAEDLSQSSAPERID